MNVAFLTCSFVFSSDVLSRALSLDEKTSRSAGERRTKSFLQNEIQFLKSNQVVSKCDVCRRLKTKALTIAKMGRLVSPKIINSDDDVMLNYKKNHFPNEDIRLKCDPTEACRQPLYTAIALNCTSVAMNYEKKPVCFGRVHY